MADILQVRDGLVVDLAQLRKLSCRSYLEARNRAPHLSDGEQDAALVFAALRALDPRIGMADVVAMVPGERLRVLLAVVPGRVR